MTVNKTKQEVQNSISHLTKKVLASHKSFEIARSRGIPRFKILEFDIFETNILFDEEGYAKKLRKHELVNSLEEYLTEGDKSFKKDIDLKASSVVDFMSLTH